MHDTMGKYINTTILGGLAAILPLALLIVIFRWVAGFVTRVLGPLVELFDVQRSLVNVALYAIAIAALLLLFFLIGWLIQTRLGGMLGNAIENTYLMKIPGYKTAKEIVGQFLGGNRTFFSEVVLVDIFNSGTLMTGFITDHHGEIITVFVPTGPNPTSGNIYHVHQSRVHKTNASVDSGMRSIIGCGAGSADVLTSVRDPLQDNTGSPGQDGT